jgi:hypothetical protein
MKAELIVGIGGGYNLLCGILHLLFPKMLKWKEELPSWSPENRAAIRILNHALMLFWLLLGWLYLFHAGEMVTTGLGRSLLIGMVLFWVIRIFVLQPVFVGIKTRESWFMIGFFAIGLILNIFAVF